MTIDDPEFEAFANAGEVEVGETVPAEQPEEKPARRAPKAKAEPEPEPVEEQDDDTDEPDQEEGDEPDQEEGDEQAEKPKKSAKDHQIERLKREKADLARQLRETERRQQQEMLERIERIEKGLPATNTGGNQESGIGPAPDPSDTEKYPLGYLDDRYIEDKLEWLTEKKAADQADAVLQRQQEIEQQTQLLEKVDNLATRGSQIYEDFQETVVEAGMRGDWELTQTTFEAAAEAENGVQILYELASDTKEASRVARMSPFQQLKYVADRDAEIGKAKQPRRIPRAGEPPQNPARGTNSRTQINPATDNLDDFAKAWEADARKSKR